MVVKGRFGMASELGSKNLRLQLAGPFIGRVVVQKPQNVFVFCQGLFGLDEALRTVLSVFVEEVMAGVWWIERVAVLGSMFVRV